MKNVATGHISFVSLTLAPTTAATPPHTNFNQSATSYLTPPNKQAVSLPDFMPSGALHPKIWGHVKIVVSTTKQIQLADGAT